jgi:hypothetical protein
MQRFFAAGLLVLALTAEAPLALTVAEVPAKTTLRFHLTEPLSSDKSKTGMPFAFVLLDPIVVDGQTLVPSGASGSGTLLLAGHAGTSGHEGDLTLRLDSIQALDGRDVYFADQQLHIDGRNKKIMAGTLGFVPFAGIGARFIRGADIRIDPATPIETVLDRAAPLGPPPPDTLTLPDSPQ